MRLWLVPSLLIFASSPLLAEVEVRVAGDRVSVRAVSAPVSEILDRLARQTGMRLVYDAALPRQLLTATLEGRTPAEVVLSVLEGLGLNYALVMDASGARVDQLLILGTPAAVTAPAPARPAQPPPAQRPAPVQQEDPLDGFNGELVDESEQDEDALDELERNAPSAPATPPPPQAPGPRPPDYPSSTFTPRLPMPTPVPTPSPTPQATPQAPRNQ